jgi:hypothetical protein
VSGSPASALCGAATGLTQLVLYRLLQRRMQRGAGATGPGDLFTVYPREATARWRSSAPGR